MEDYEFSQASPCSLLKHRQQPAAQDVLRPNSAPMSRAETLVPGAENEASFGNRPMSSSDM